MSLFRVVAMSVLILVVGCEAASSPETAEYIEVFNQPTTHAGEENLHDITYVRIIHLVYGSGLPHAVRIRPGESRVFSVLYPGDYELRVRYEGDWDPSRQDPENPFHVRNASTAQVHFWH